MMNICEVTNFNHPLVAEDYEAMRTIAQEMLECIDAGLAAIKYVQAVDAQFNMNKLTVDLNHNAYIEMQKIMNDFLCDRFTMKMTSLQLNELLDSYKADVRMLQSIAKSYRRSAWFAQHVFGVANSSSKTTPVSHQRTNSSLLNALLWMIAFGLLLFNYLY